MHRKGALDSSTPQSKFSLSISLILFDLKLLYYWNQKWLTTDNARQLFSCFNTDCEIQLCMWCGRISVEVYLGLLNCELLKSIFMKYLRTQQNFQFPSVTAIKTAIKLNLWKIFAFLIKISFSNQSKSSLPCFSKRILETSAIFAALFRSPNQ